ncbi:MULTISPECIES: hypothetical protein [Streptococcus]|uniref:hypothetical protein n=1 Tax=Streptococcus TaxID=1301 RepID=UPI000F5EB9EF|nr:MULTISPECIES: hypothetical protein [Streptococcus]RRD33102.1 hypothetical protein EII37_08045 [Streptococcus sp. OH4692_COT-348]
MANFAQGTIKLRGRAENIKSALKYMFSTVVDITIKEDGEIITFSTTDSHFYINGTRRAFIDNDSFKIYLDDDFLIIELEDFKQAWAAIADNYTEISSKFDVDIKIFTFEMGMEFTQEIEISKGKILKDIVHEYDNYRWEVPFSNFGG